jgi:hypothetical protein
MTTDPSKRVFSYFIFFVIIFLALTPTLTKAEQTGDFWGQITVEDLQASEPAILAGNPFYFLKGWSWQIKKAFSENIIEELAISFQILNEKAAETKKITKIAPNSETSLAKALAEYQKAAYQYEISLKKVANLNSSQYSSEFLKFISSSEKQLITHLLLIDELKLITKQSQNQAILLDLAELIEKNLILIAQKINTSENFSTSILNLKKDQSPIFLLRTAEKLLALTSLNSEDTEQIILNKKFYSLYLKAIGEVEKEIIYQENNNNLNQVINEINSLIGIPEQRQNSLQTIINHIPQLNENLQIIRFSK